MRLIIARHAESNPLNNQVAEISGVIGALSEKGKDQAAKLASHLKDFRISYIYSSDILRAIATSYVISDEMPDVTVMLTRDLRIKETNETEDEFNARVKKFVEGVCNKYDNQTILLLTHSDVILSLFKALEVKNPTAPGLAAVSEFIIKTGTEPSVIRINDTSFL